MRLGFLFLLLVCTLARADASLPSSSPSLSLHALARKAWRGRSTDLGGGGAFLNVREGIEILVPRQFAYHRLVIKTERGWFVDDFADTLLDDEPGRSHALVGPMSARVDQGILLVRGRRAIWKRDYAQPRLEPTYSCEELLVACMLGPDGAPLCSAPLLVGDEPHCLEADDQGGGDWSVRHWDWHLDATARAPDQLALHAAHGRPPRAHQARGLPIVVGELRLGGARQSGESR